MKKMGAALAAAMMMLSLAACDRVDNNNYNLECDRGDQAEHDSDCGYVDNSGQWQWYSWVVYGNVSHSPDNWEPPAGVTIEQEDDSHHNTPKKKSVTKPATKKATPVKTRR